jgi:hypothetical protein
MAKKKNKSKMSLSVKKSSKQKKGQQKQSQSVSVNVNLGKRGGGRSKPTNPTPKLPSPFPFNFPPGFNQNFPYSFNLPPPPIPQKQYSVFPEGETATALNLLSNVPVPLKVEGSPLKAKAKEPKPEAYKVINEPFKAPEEEYQLIEPQPPAPPPPFVEPAPELAVVGGEAQQFFPEEPPSPTASTISGFTAEPTGILSPSFYNVAGLGLSKVSQSLPLPPIGPSAQPLTSSGLTVYSQPSNFPPEYLFEEGGKPKKKGLAGFIEGAPEPVKEKKKAGAPRGPRKPKYEASVPAGQTQFAIPVKETSAFAIPAQLSAEGAYSLSAPLSQQPSAQFLGSEKTFSLAPPPPEKISGGLERQRRETALTPAEQTLLSNPLFA